MQEVTFFVFAFTSIFVIVNPVSALLTFVSLTEGMDLRERNAAARRSVVTACVLALVFALGGEFILRMFHITEDNLRVAGGALLFIVAVDMLHGKLSRESVTPEELKDASRRRDISIFPLATPLLTGPGAITAVIVLIHTAERLVLKLIVLGAILATFAIAYVLFRFAERAHRLLGVTASLVITRIMGILLAAIAVNFMAEGIWNIYKAFSG
ncbi:MAG: MarC family protein [Nitrospirota bacterium]|jgi:multiple antibiotic resistance protein